MYQFEEIEIDAHLPSPTPLMLLEKDRQIYVKQYSVITDLTDQEREILELTEEFGWQQIEVLTNFSDSIRLIDDFNFGTSSKILRYN